MHIPADAILQSSDRAARQMLAVGIAFLVHIGILIVLGVRSGTNWMGLESPYTMALAVGFVAGQLVLLLIVKKDHERRGSGGHDRTRPTAMTSPGRCSPGKPATPPGDIA